MGEVKAIRIAQWVDRNPVETGIEDGIEWAIYAHDSLGSINGYARIPENHPWRKLNDWQWDCSAGVEVHGGITFGITEDGWIGFDTSHAWDVWEGSKYAREHGDGSDTYWTQEMVVDETKSLVRQIALAQLSPQPEAREEQVSLGEVTKNDDIRSIMNTMISDIERHQSGENPLPIWTQARLDELKVIFRLTPPPVELPEPKEFGAMIEAGFLLGDEITSAGHRTRWVRGCNYFHSEDGYMRKFSDLINPRIVGGAE